MAKKIYTIIGVVLTVGLFVMLCVWGCGLSQKLRDTTNSKAKLIESNRVSIAIITDMEQELRDRDGRLERSTGIIETLQQNLTKSETYNRELEAANKRLTAIERRRQKRESEGKRIIAEIEKGIRNLTEDIEAIPILDVD